MTPTQRTLVRSWRTVRREARNLGLAARVHDREHEVVISLRRDGRVVIAIAAMHDGYRGIVRAPSSRAVCCGFGEDSGRDGAARIAVDLALSELARLHANRLQWSGGLS